MADSERMFPVMLTWVPMREQRKYAHCPREVPWRLVEPHEAQAKRNHNQTVQRLSERGGLSPLELYFVMTDQDWPRGLLRSDDLDGMNRTAIEWLILLITKSDAAQQATDSTGGGQ